MSPRQAHFEDQRQKRTGYCPRCSESRQAGQAEINHRTNCPIKITLTVHAPRPTLHDPEAAQ